MADGTVAMSDVVLLKALRGANAGRIVVVTEIAPDDAGGRVDCHNA